MLAIKTFTGEIVTLEPHQIYVFGSNTQGRHGKGNALIAKERFGAKYGQAEGLQGQSYAIITKDLTKKAHPSRTRLEIIEQIAKLYAFARENDHLEFYVTYNTLKPNLNSYTHKEMAHMFATANDIIPDNVLFDNEFAMLMMVSNI